MLSRLKYSLFEIIIINYINLLLFIGFISIISYIYLIVYLK